MDYCPRCYKHMTEFHTCEKFTITDGGDETVMWGKDFKDVVERCAKELSYGVGIQRGKFTHIEACT